MSKRLIDVALKARKTGKSNAENMLKRIRRLDEEFHLKNSKQMGYGKNLRTTTMITLSLALSYVK